MRTTRLALRALVPVVLAAAATGIAQSPAVAAAPDNGCPPTYDIKYVADLAPLGYRVPGLVDSPDSGILSFGLPGNGDGLICAHPSGNRLTPFGEQVYNFWDNTLLTR